MATLSANDLSYYSDHHMTLPERERAAKIMEAAGVRQVREHEWTVPSSSNPDKNYTVTWEDRTDDGYGHVWDCTCPARKVCKHINYVSDIQNAIYPGYE